MEEIIVIRVIDSNENIFNSIMAALHDKSIKVMETSSSILSFGDVEIHPFSRCVLKAGKEVHLNHGELFYAVLSRKRTWTDIYKESALFGGMG